MEKDRKNSLIIVLQFVSLGQVYLIKLNRTINMLWKTFNAIASLSIEVDSKSDEWDKTNVKLQLGMVGGEFTFQHNVVASRGPGAGGEDGLLIT